MLRTIRNTPMLQSVTERREPAMYVCLCNALTDRDVSAHMAGGNWSVSMVYRALGCQPQCGKCVPYVRQMLRQALSAADAGNGGDDWMRAGCAETGPDRKGTTDHILAAAFSF